MTYRTTFDVYVLPQAPHRNIRSGKAYALLDLLAIFNPNWRGFDKRMLWGLVKSKDRWRFTALDYSHAYPIPKMAVGTVELIAAIEHLSTSPNATGFAIARSLPYALLGTQGSRW